MHPFHSVGQLHVHCICEQLKTFAWDNFINVSVRVDDDKNPNVLSSDINETFITNSGQPVINSGQIGGSSKKRIMKNPFDEPIKELYQSGGSLRNKTDLKNFVLNAYEQNPSLKKRVHKMATM